MALPSCTAEVVLSRKLHLRTVYDVTPERYFYFTKKKPEEFMDTLEITVSPIRKPLQVNCRLGLGILMIKLEVSGSVCLEAVSDSAHR